MAAVDVIYSRRPAAGSVALCALQGLKRWSHVAIVDGDRVIQAVGRHGVIATPLSEHLAGIEVCEGWPVLSRLGAWERVAIDCPNPAAALAFAREQIGKRYDWLGLAAFPLRPVAGLFRSPLDDHDRWFCSELLEAALIAGGRSRFREMPAHVSPWGSYFTT